MDTILFFKAALIGLSVAAPVGPIGLLCIQRTLAQGRRVGFVSGLGAAAADACYGAVGAFGVSALTAWFVALRSPLALAGGLFLGWMGWRMLRSRGGGGEAAVARPARSGWAAFASVLALTLANPMTIVSFTAIFASLGARGAGAASPGLMVAGVFVGSAAWWLGLSMGVAAVRTRIDARGMRRVDQFAGVVLLAFALYQLRRWWAG
ncbi:lysine transporter LysE [Rhodoferax koreense]|uniref:Lysine transporter LysE n=1 Tax=Rhodoferax koreensis TaxID=1842727 RepID=A0A1P8JYR9_9BURK|nr:LysE family translocator [Rhodoferax koreense]APW38894.1 lysine transporter LysE [Rhodoferax koreense]